MSGKTIGAAVAVVFIATLLVQAADEVHEGKVVAVTSDTIILLDNRDGDQDQFAVTAETKITRDGKPARLNEIRAGDRAKVIAGTKDDKPFAKQIDARSPE